MKSDDLREYLRIWRSNANSYTVPRGILSAQLLRSCEIIDDLIMLAENTAKKPEEIQEIMRHNNLIIDNLDDPMQKLAFTIYTELVSLSTFAENILENENET